MATEIQKALVIDQNQTSTIQINEEEEEKEDNGYDADVTCTEEANNSGARQGGRNNTATASKSKASELTLSFEGKVYVFHKVDPEKVQAVLSILGGSDVPDGGQCPRCLNVSRRIASLVKFREKRKDRYYDKKFRKNAHKKAEHKMDKKSVKSPIEVNETFQTGGNIPMETDIGVSKEIEIEVPKLGMIFQSDDEAYDFYNRYARSVGFSIRKSSSTHRSDKTVSRRIFCCSKEGVYREHSRGAPMKPRLQTRTDCKARLVIRIQDDGSYSVAEFILEHNHELVPPSEVHVLRSHRKMREAQIGMFNNLQFVGTGATGFYSYINAEGGRTHNLNFTQVDLSNHLDKRSKNILMTEDVQIVLDYFNCMQKENPYFFYSIQMDVNNQICGCFWSDAKSRIDYSFFGDVVCVETTFRTSDYDKPCALFVGVNNHGQAIPFGCGLLWEETTESFVWLFQTFLEAMNGKQPESFFTDQAPHIADAVGRVLPNSHHRLCSWHIYENALRHLSDVFEQYKSFAQDFKSCICCNETEEEFQFCWDALVKKYNLAKNEWLQDLYLLREKWAQIYVQEYFCAGITTTKIDGGMNFVKKYFKRTLTLREFVARYEKAVASRREKEKNQDSVSRQTKPDLRIAWPAVVQAAKRYTTKIFTLFQEEYVRTLDLFVESLGEDGTLCTYRVSSFENIKLRTVTFNSSDNIVKCSCKKFESMGILCSHALKILHTRRLPDLPLQYYLNRWTRDARAGAVVDDFRNSLPVSCRSSLTLQYADLAYVSLTIAVKGSSTENSTSFAKVLLSQVLEELDNFLKFDSDQSRFFEDSRNANHEKVSRERVVDHSCADTMLQNLPRKKAKDKASGKIKSLLEKGKKRDKALLQPTGTDGQIGQVSVGATETTPGPLMVSVPSSVPFYPARPWNLPHYSQGSIKQVEQATVIQTENDSVQCRVMSGGWSGPPSCPSEMLPPNVMGCPDTSDPRGLPFRAAGPPNLPQMPCVYPHVYTEGPNRFVDQTMFQHGAGSNDRSNQRFIGFPSQGSNPHRLAESSMPQSQCRQDFLEPPAP
ncbi:hypothetical protein MKW94_026412 [Papaver nudicaule]|uniref:Protein FAR1-RELATED SEQUENCE n=1 Tax=Papaver nudicaule TaxID=74823 RepID=A0AA41SM48_PAPNU|nr:hypothetical protein [Papaver nudicaule]